MKNKEMKNEDMDMATRLARLTQTADALIGLLRKETDAVKNADMNAFNQMQPMKWDLYEMYEGDHRSLMAKKEDLKSISDAQRQKLRTLDQELASVRTENLSALERAGKSFARLQDRILSITRDEALRVGAQYGANGRLRTSAKRMISTGHRDHA